MFILENGENALPVKIWLENESDLEQGCLEQARNLSRLPFLYKWIALMPDAHQGMGMPIGGVIAAVDTVIPNAVGVDIGCGMCYVSSDVPAHVLKIPAGGEGTLLQALIGDILRDTPVGFAHHSAPCPSRTLDGARKKARDYRSCQTLWPQIEAGYRQIGTLGGGNHFIEIQEDEAGMTALMIHSGSRNFGKRICEYFHGKALQLNRKMGSSLPESWRLAYLPAASEEGKEYILWMRLAMDFAMENRACMMERVRRMLENRVKRHAGRSPSFGEEINCHHNYASLEEHYGRRVWVHRKGAVRARRGEKALIPGAMGSFSYVAEGLGNPESFHTSSHGAGRLYSRKAAVKKFAAEEVLRDLKETGVVLGKHNKRDVAEESRFAYKDIDGVMDCQRDLVRPLKKLRTVGVVKG